jgi:hypothetical protein
VKRAILALLLVLLPLASASGWRIMYKEQYYKLYHEQLYHYPDDTMEQIHYLEEAMKADFCNPLYALAKIDDEIQWERYRYLFNLHVNLQLIYLYRQLGAKWDKQVAYFYNAPWKRQNLESLATAEQIYRVAYRYWEEAKQWSARAWAMRTVHLPKIQKWEDDNWRIETGDLDYREIIDENLAHLAKVRADFEKMDAGTY